MVCLSEHANAQRAVAPVDGPAIDGSNVRDPIVGERIDRFHSDIHVEPDGSLRVTETIRVIARRKKIKRGIYRDLPTSYPGPWGTRVRVPLQITQVQRDGKTEPYHTTRQGNGIRLYIGDKNVMLPAGSYTYRIQYTTQHQIGFFTDHDELYWNVTGNGWQFPIVKITATVHLPAKVPAESLRTEAFTGRRGARDRDFTTRLDGQTGALVFETARPLAPGEGLTIVAGFPKGLVIAPSAEERRLLWLSSNGPILVGLAGLLFLTVYYFAVWLKVGRDPQPRSIQIRSEPPLGMGPAEIRYLVRMGYDRKCFVAALVSLAARGFCTIHEQEGSFRLLPSDGDRPTPPMDELPPAERALAQQLRDVLPMELKNKNHGQIAKMVGGMKKALRREYFGKMFQLNRKWLLPGTLLSLGTLAGFCLMSDATILPIVAFLMVWLTFWTFFVTLLVVLAANTWRRWIRGPDKGIAGLVAAIFLTAFSCPFVAGEVVGLWMLVNVATLWIVPILFGVLAVNGLFYYLLRRPTFAARPILDQIEGYRRYLSGRAPTDAPSGPPERSDELTRFAKHLPYAIALDLEQNWSEAFQQALAETATPLPWYTGYPDRTPLPDRFDDRLPRHPLTHFGERLSSTLGSAVTSASSAPGSSSGFSGGSSGGGGGGGGGGGW